MGRFPHIQTPRPKPADPPPTPPFQGGEQGGGYPNHFGPVVERRHTLSRSPARAGGRHGSPHLQDGGRLLTLPRKGEVAGACQTEGAAHANLCSASSPPSPSSPLPGREGPGVGRFPHIQTPRPKPADPPPTPPFQGGEQGGGYPNHFGPIVERRHAPSRSPARAGEREGSPHLQDGGCLAILPRQGQVAPQASEGEDTEQRFSLPPPPSGYGQPPPPGGGGSFQPSLRT